MTQGMLLLLVLFGLDAGGDFCQLPDFASFHWLVACGSLDEMLI